MFQSFLEGLTSSVTKEDITRTVIYCLEKTRQNLKTRSRAIGVRVHQVVQIIDMDGLVKQHITFTGMYNKIRKKRFKPVNSTVLRMSTSPIKIPQKLRSIFLL